MYELFDHTADLGFRIIAADLNTLFAEAAECLFSAAMEDISTIRQIQEIQIDIAGNDLVYLLFDWLKELLYRFDGEGMVFGRFDVTIRPDGLSARAWGEPLDIKRHALCREVKAITYHDMIVEQTPAGWLAEVIVDI